MKYWNVIKIDSSKYSSFTINGLTYEQPFNFTTENIDILDTQVSPGYWNRNQIPSLLDGIVDYETKGNLLKINSISSNDDEKLKNSTFLKSIGMINLNEYFFINIPSVATDITLNFSFEDESVMYRDWNYPIIFNKKINLETDCILWISGTKNNKKCNHPLQYFNVDIDVVLRD